MTTLLSKAALLVTTGMLPAAGLVDCSSSGSAANDVSDAGSSASVDAGGKDASIDASAGNVASEDANSGDVASHDAGAEDATWHDADAGDGASVADTAWVRLSDASASDTDAGAPDARPDASPDAAPPSYSPCPPAGTACVIMPLGDSITYGFGSSTGGGYRLRLLHDIWAANLDATFVGDNSSGPNALDGKAFPKSNEGYSGYTIAPAPAVSRAGISSLVPAALAKYSPHIVTLMIGTNDIGTNNDLPNAPTRLANLVDLITTKSPNALLVVGQIIPTGSDTSNALTQAYNAAIPALVKSRAAAGKHVVVIDMYSAFTRHASYRTDYMNDALHPNDTGYAVMGDTWYAALAPHL